MSNLPTIIPTPKEFAENSTDAGYPALDGNGNLVADVTLRTGTANELKLISDAGNGEIAVCTDIDGIMVYRDDPANPGVSIGKVITRNGNLFTYFSDTTQTIPVADTVYALDEIVPKVVPDIIDSVNDTFIIQDYMRDTVGIVSGGVHLMFYMRLSIVAEIISLDASATVTFQLQSSLDGSIWTNRTPTISGTADGSGNVSINEIAYIILLPSVFDVTHSLRILKKNRQLPSC